jgi:regulator of protease activity HflC (stomatin/prohibitin superfamily)
MDAQKASYGVSDYHFAIVQLAQTTMRSEIGKIDLDKTFEERGNINTGVVKAVDEAAQQWGVKTLRYEIKNITPPKSVLEAMQKQMTAEREKRALILNSEGQKQSAINVAEGKKQQAILESEGEKQRRINEAEGNAQAIQRIAEATGKGILEIARAINENGGFEAVQFRIADKLADQFGQIAKAGNTIVVPASFSDPASLVATTMGVIKRMSPTPQSS